MTSEGRPTTTSARRFGRSGSERAGRRGWRRRSRPAALLSSSEARDRSPLDWAATQTNLGTALNTLGWRESSSARLEEAVAAFDACLTVGKTAWPEEWARASALTFATEHERKSLDGEPRNKRAAKLRNPGGIAVKTIV